MDSGIEIRKTHDYELWYSSLSGRVQAQISARLERIQDAGHFGDVKHIGDKLCELRWKNGLRIYFCRTEKDTIVLLIGGLKNAQEKDIKKARLLLE